MNTIKNLILLIITANISFAVYAQPTSCFEITSILVDPCGLNEGQNEMVYFELGSNELDVNNLTVNWANTAMFWQGLAMNASTALKTTTLNGSVINDTCGFLIEPLNDTIPAYSHVILCTSYNIDPLNVSFAGLADTLYILYQNSTATTDYFENVGTGIRTFSMVFSPTCTDTVQYDRALLGVGNGDRVNYQYDGTSDYLNNGCSGLYFSDDASWSSYGVICDNSSPVNLNIYLTGSIGGTWSGSGVTGNMFDPSGLNGNISLTYTVGTPPCNASQVNTVQVVPTADASWNAPDTICDNQGSIDLSTMISGTTGGIWSGPGVTGNTLNPQSIIGNIYVTYTVGTFPCDDSRTDTIFVVSGSYANWSNPGAVCENEGTINLSSLVTGTAGGVWAGTGVSGTTFDPVGLSGYIRLTYTVGSTPCVDSETDSILVTTPPVASAGNDTSVCFGSSVTLTATGGGTYLWSTTDVSTNTTVSPTTDSTFSVIVTNNGCSDTAQVNVIINSLPVIDTTLLTIVDETCNSSNGSITGITVTGNPTFIYDWIDGGGLLIGNTLDITNLSTQTYSILVTDTFGCISNAGPFIVENIGNSLTIDTSSVFLFNSNCEHDDGKITGVQIINDTTAITNWYNSSGGLVGNTIDLVDVTAGTYTLIITNYCDTATYTYSLSKNSALTIDLGPDIDTCETDRIHLTPGSYATYNWSTGESSSFIDVYEAGVYSVEVFDQYGCNASDTIEVLTHDCNLYVYIPNTFTPNNDGFNDKFYVSANVDDYKIRIYDRWGTLMYNSKDIYEGWDGIYGGNLCPTGTYTYLVYIKREDTYFDYSGMLHLIR